MAAGRVRAVAVALAILVVAALGWWLSGSGPAAPPVEEGTRPGIAKDNVSSDETSSGARPAPDPKNGGKAAKKSGATVPGDDAADEVPAPAKVEGVCFLEEGGPLPGVQLVYTVLLPSGGTDASTAESGKDGCFDLVMNDGATSIRRIDVDDNGFRLVSVEGGTLEEGTRRIKSITGPLRLGFREKPGNALVRLIDADTGTPLVELKGLRVSWHLPGGLLRMGFTTDQVPGGWIPVPEGRLPETGPGKGAGIEADPAKVEVEFHVQGYEAARLPLTEVRGRVELRVRPVPPDATGVIRAMSILGDLKALPSTSTIQMPTISTAVDDTLRVSIPVSAHLRWTGPEPAPDADEILGIPVESGPFSLFDLPDGSWEIEIAATLPDNTVVRGKKAFEKHGGTVDLGTIELKPAGKVRIRVVDSADQPIPQAWAVIVRPEENPDQGRRLDLDDKGMVSVGDLEPGIGHRAVVKGLPRDLEQTVVASADAKPVEFKWPEKLVPCRIALLVDGKAVANADGRTTIPAVVQESPLPRDKGAWKSDGTFEAKLLPGTYKFSVLATPKEGGALAVFAGEVTVPSGDAFESRLELTKGDR